MNVSYQSEVYTAAPIQDKEQFVKGLRSIVYSGGSGDFHEDLDTYLVSVLESMGYDLTLFKEAEKWYN